VPSEAPAPWKLAEDAVVRGDADALAALLREHADLREQHDSSWQGGLSPSYVEDEARAIIAREHHFESWDAFAAHAAARRDPASPVARFEAAIDAIVGGDLDTLTRLLRDDPGLVRMRSARQHGSMLIHYVGSNGVEGFRQKAPANIVAITAVLLDAGAEIDAPAGMYGGGYTALGLAATSCHPVHAGVLEPLLTFLLDRGASPTVLPGGWSGLINACHANGRPAAATFLAPRADRLDLEAAAGLGRLDLVEPAIASDGTPVPPATLTQRNDGFSWACEYGQTEVVRFLLSRGLPAGEKLRPHGQTGLHWAAWGAHLDTVGVLLAAGAPVDTRDDSFGGTALGWALYAWGGGGPGPGDARYYEVVQALTRAGATLDQAWTDDRSSLAEALRRDPRMRAALSLDAP
jgi:hypothetical protein